MSDGRTAPTVSIVICARNEAENLPYVLRHARPYGDELLVVDGGSTDATREIAARAGARVVSDNGKGKGDAIRVGIREARGELLVFIDADCSHNPHEVPLLLEPLLAGRADHVTGSRVIGGSEELHGDFGKFVRRIGSDIITMGINLRFGVGLTDSQNGFRAIRADLARRLDLRENITTIEQELIIKSLAAGGRLAEVPTREAERRSGTSCIDVRRMAFRYVYSWLKYLLLERAPLRRSTAATGIYKNPRPWWEEDPADPEAAVSGRGR